MSDISLNQAIESIYASLKADNQELDLRIAELKAAMAREGTRQVTFEPGKLAQNNRQGRKLMQAYFRQKGIKIDFAG